MPTIKQNDLGEAWTDTLLKDGVAYNLTGKLVSIRIKNISNGRSEVYPASIVVAASGTVSYTPALANVQPGEYAVEWVVTDSTTLRQVTFPSTGSIQLIVEPVL